MALAQNALMYERMLFGDSFDWKWVMLLSSLHFGGLAIEAMVGSMS